MSAGPGRRMVRWAPWLVLVVVAAVALGVGVSRSGRPTQAQEITSIGNQVRCPVCSGETAAESNTVQAQSIMTVISGDVRAGESRSNILASMSSRYGPGILEKPSTGGTGLILWVLPGVAFAVALGGLIAVFARRRRRSVAVTDADRTLVAGARREGMAS